MAAAGAAQSALLPSCVEVPTLHADENTRRARARAPTFCSWLPLVNIQHPPVNPLSMLSNHHDRRRAAWHTLRSSAKTASEVVISITEQWPATTVVFLEI